MEHEITSLACVCLCVALSQPRGISLSLPLFRFQLPGRRQSAAGRGKNVAIAKAANCFSFGLSSFARAQKRRIMMSEREILALQKGPQKGGTRVKRKNQLPIFGQTFAASTTHTLFCLRPLSSGAQTIKSKISLSICSPARDSCTMAIMDHQ